MLLGIQLVVRHFSAGEGLGMSADRYSAYWLLGKTGYRERHNTNVHLAVRPSPGSVAAVGSAYGVRFSIQNAQAIPIQHPMLPESPPHGLADLPQDHIRCKNFQFGCQVFKVVG